MRKRFFSNQTFQTHTVNKELSLSHCLSLHVAQKVLFVDPYAIRLLEVKAITISHIYLCKVEMFPINKCMSSSI